MDFSTKLSLPYLLPNQAQKHVTVNESLRALDALVQLSVLSKNETVPPTNPNDGDRYIPAAESEGEWLAQEGMLACFQDGVWRFYQPQAGWMAWVEVAQSFWVFDGSDWQASGGEAPADKLGVNTSADAYNRFALRAPASLFDNEGAGHQLKINKASEAETASLLFQTGYTGHAEMGLAGNNNFNVKVSADGQSIFQCAFGASGQWKCRHRNLLADCETACERRFADWGRGEGGFALCSGNRCWDDSLRRGYRRRFEFSDMRCV